MERDIATNLVESAAADIESVDRLIEKAIKFRYVSVMVSHSLVGYAARKLKGTGIQVITRIDFPLGISSKEGKAALTRLAVSEGAGEIEIVLNVAKIRNWDENYLIEEICACQEVARGRKLRLIVDHSLYGPEERSRLYALASKMSLPTTTIASLSSQVASSPDQVIAQHFDDRLLRVNLETMKLEVVDLPSDIAYRGGRALVSRLISSEISPQVDPSGRHNKIIMAPGLLAGFGIPCCGSISVGAKSPLTKGIRVVNGMGTFGTRLARTGLAAIILEGTPTEGVSFLLKISKGRAELLSSGELAMKGVYEAAGLLRAAHGEKAGILLVGPAAEMGFASAGLFIVDSTGYPEVLACRGGLGYVLAKRGIKAIIVDDSSCGPRLVKNRTAVDSAIKDISEILSEHPVTGRAFPAYGTAVLINIINEAAALPTRNFSSGVFESADLISGERLSEIIEERNGEKELACLEGCPVRCRNVFVEQNGKRLAGGIDYDVLASLGANCGVSDLDSIAKIYHDIIDFGLDPVEFGGALAVAMDCGQFAFGDARAFSLALEQMRGQTITGRMLSQGVALTGKLLSARRIPQVKGLGMSPIEPRAAKGMGVTYATSPFGADHTAGFAAAANILKIGGDVEASSRDRQVDLSRNMQITAAILDTFGFCFPSSFAIMDNPGSWECLTRLANSVHGLKFSVSDLSRLGRAVLREERKFNERAGFTRADDRLPEFFYEEPLIPTGARFDIDEQELDNFFNF